MSERTSIEEKLNITSAHKEKWLSLPPNTVNNYWREIQGNPIFSPYHVAEFGMDIQGISPDKHFFLYLPQRIDTRSDYKIIEDYVFTKEQIKLAQLWLNGRFNALVLDGPTGCGKTTFIEQLSARLNWPLLQVSCSLEKSSEELLSHMSLRDGKTVWEEGLAVKAMREGSILLLDEFNALPPETAIGLHKIFEQGGYTLPTGERVKPHDGFRIVACGNALNGQNASSYSGTVRNLNIATMNRFGACLKMDYLSKEKEIQMLHGRFPYIPAEILEFFVDLSSYSRSEHNKGELSNLMSMRTLLDICSSIQSLNSYSWNDDNDENSRNHPVLDVLNWHFVNFLQIHEQEPFVLCAKMYYDTAKKKMIEKAKAEYRN